MMFHRWSLAFLLTATGAFAGDSLSPRASVNDYPAQQTAGNLSIGVAHIAPGEMKRLFGEDLDKHGYVVFEVGVFPGDSLALDLSPDDFKLRQGKDPSYVRSATPHQVARDIRPDQKQKEPPKLPGNIHVETVETVGYERGPYGRGVYTSTGVGVSRGGPESLPPPPSGSSATQEQLENELSDRALKEVKTTKAVAGYVFFPKAKGKLSGDFEILYFGDSGQISIQVAARR